ncbi:glutamate receptor ionotropic, kainate 2-like isoform X3 [Cylas formicarius]|uniref:glutamate receptor ionotropic, kainate 2-like isoform X3 n=1 Tax=Cylas formicarius TaxID=197179 RepID=UPI0029586E2F|nr:glutamate receptor ionotropic, kainate 2-like isoform X3 [Cylas formicarius]
MRPQRDPPPGDALGRQNRAKQLVQRFGWERMVVLFEDDDSLLRTAPLLDLNIYHGVNIILRQLELDESQSYRGVLNAIKSSEETNLLLDCSVETLGKVLKQAQQVGLMTDRYRYIVTSLDVGVLDLTDFQYSGVNLTGIWLFDPSHPKATKYEDAMLDALGLPAESLWKMKLSTALLLDGVRLFYETIGEFGDTQSELLSTQSLSCDGTKYWRFGYTIVNTIKAKKFQGITGQIQFDNEGFRRNFVLEVVELTPAGLSVVGQWNSSVGELKVDRSRVRVHQEPAIANPFNRTFTVITTLTAPYAMLKETTAQLTGNDRFEGFCVDVIQELSAMLGFNYTFIIQADGANGDLNRITYEWNGMIREIIDGNADLAIADLTITSERENAVDFTMPFMNLGISVLYRKPEPVPPSLFMFTSPFSTSVWVMLGVAYLLVSFAIFIMGRLSPSEWTNPFPCVEEPEYLINQFSIRNSLWFTIGALMQQGSELAPISVSTRTASGFWWFFVLIMVSSYTANLAAFLTVETLVTPFKNIDELARQDEIKYGAKKKGSTEYFFRDSNLSTYKRVWEFMSKHPEVQVSDNDEGVRRVEQENYAYLMESTTIEYVTQRHCSLAQVGGLLDDKGYGIAMKKFSPYRNDLSTAILKLQESGRLTQLKIKWWKEKRGGSTCGTKKEEAEATALDLKNVGGVFLVLFVGSMVALAGSLIESAVFVYRRCKTSNTTFGEELKKEFRFILHFKRQVKVVK